jgi:CubicO group peptidase (beta-lactamase class C family)
MRRFSRRELLKHTFVWAASTAVGRGTPASAEAVAGGDISERERAAMARVVEAFREKYGVPGLALAIAHEGRLVYDEAFGFAERERAEALTTRHRFRIASVSKPITSCAILDLVETGRLKLDDRVFGGGAVLGTRFGHTPYRRYVEDVTIGHLLTQTGGGWRNDASDPMFRNRDMEHAELISWTLDSLPLENPPGSSYGYSNFGYCVLGRVLEAVTGRSYVSDVQRRVLAPCGVRRMEVAANTLGERLEDEVRYYGQSGENPYVMNVRRMDSHGGWVATARDLVAFVTHVDGFSTPPDILRAETIAAMTAPTTANRGYAKGWSVNAANNWWHSGSLPGTATILVRTASGFCWAALTNTRRPASDMDLALDNMVWDAVSQTDAWRSRR